MHSMSLVYSGTMEVPSELTLFFIFNNDPNTKDQVKRSKDNSYTCGNYFKQVALSVYV